MVKTNSYTFAVISASIAYVNRLNMFINIKINLLSLTKANDFENILVILIFHINTVKDGR